MRHTGALCHRTQRERSGPLQVVPGHIHAFVNATGVGRTSSAALAEAVDALVAGMRTARLTR
jgi:acetyl esterase